MDIDGHLRNARESDRKAALDAERLKTETAASILVLQQVFSEFRDALIRHNVPQFPLVRLNTEFVPAKRRLFGSTPAHQRMTATVVGACWRFHGILLFDDGSILGAHHGAVVGSQVAPYGFGRAHFLEVASQALSEAGLGTELSTTVFTSRTVRSFLTWTGQRRGAGSGAREFSCMST